MDEYRPSSFLLPSSFFLFPPSSFLLLPPLSSSLLLLPSHCSPLLPSKILPIPGLVSECKIRDLLEDRTFNLSLSPKKGGEPVYEKINNFCCKISRGDKNRKK
jgi:hypothetical protein